MSRKGLFAPGYNTPENACEGLDASTHPDHHFEAVHVDLRKLVSSIEILFIFLQCLFRGSR
jgi:hypothetical protein